MQDEAYQKEYDAEMAKLDEAAKATTSNAPAEKLIEPEKSEPIEEAKTDEVDPVAEIRAKLEQTEKALKDTQKWGHENAQRLKQIEIERERQQREATKPAILDANPELAEAIRYVASDPVPKQQQENRQNQWQEIVDRAHPGIFDLSIDPELEKALLARRAAIGAEWDDPLIAIREITAEKLAFAERQVGKRFAAESAKQAQKSAMSVPGAGASAVSHAPENSDAEAVQRIQKMSPSEFAKEVARVKGH